MIKFIKTKDENNNFDISDVEFRFDSSCSLNEMLEEFGYFLKAIGYQFDGDIEIVDNSEPDYSEVSLSEIEQEETKKICDMCNIETTEIVDAVDKNGRIIDVCTNCLMSDYSDVALSEIEQEEAEEDCNCVGCDRHNCTEDECTGEETPSDDTFHTRLYDENFTGE